MFCMLKKKKSLGRDLEHIQMTWMKFIEMNATMCEMKSTLDFGSFLSVFSLWDPYNVNVGVFNVVPEVS